MRTQIALLSTLSLLLAACSNIPDKQAPRASLKAFGLAAEQQQPRVVPGVTRIDRPTSKRVTQRDILSQFEGTARLRKEARLAVVELADHANSQVARPVGERELSAFKARLKKAEQTPFKRVETVPEFLLPTELSLTTLRYSAARVRADLLLVLTRASERYDYNNGWSNLYLTVIGWFVVPGNTLEIDTAAEAALIDVRTGQILGVTSASQQDSTRLLPLARNRASMRELSDLNARSLFGMLADKTLEMAKQIQ